MFKMVSPNVLADRYATPQMANIWSPWRKVLLMRELWIAAMKAQRELGMDIPAHAIEAYERVKEDIDLSSIAEREKKFKHDVMANIAEFNYLAGGIEFVHRGFTSRDVTDNLEQLQVMESLRLVRERSASLLFHFQKQMTEYWKLEICGRSHLVPGQLTTLGKRFATYAEEFLFAFTGLEQLIERYPLRGIKGPMGTQQDMLGYLKDKKKVLEFEKRMAKHLCFENLCISVGQVYPRMLDFEVISTLVSLASAPANFVKMVRLMAGNELAHEGFGDEQAGSSAMPHKVNSRTCERITGMFNLLKGYSVMASELAGDQWYEGDVSCSVVRRVVLPDAFYALDGLFEAAMHVLDEMEVFPKAIEAECDRFLPLLSSTAILRAAVEKGIGREEAHAAIKKAAVAAVNEMREGRPNDLVDRLCNSLPLERFELETCIKRDFGLAHEQVADMFTEIQRVLKKYPESVTYRPYEIR